MMPWAGDHGCALCVYSAYLRMAVLPVSFISLLSCLCRLWHHQESTGSPESDLRQLFAGRNRAFPREEEGAHQEPANPPQPERPVCGTTGTCSQDPTEEVPLPPNTQVRNSQAKGPCAKKPVKSPAVRSV